ncbi:ABC transporter related [Alkaliphilus metalliredigens QYMF]|uniref:ABC transporter related n=1 Tax=Alkaliphilus metalliredigens (strain QYMF) TaxID=293826 RepID=A6TM23_ALKMQ|nr:ATP-binding cassette domain-containing protein [Alkaliphilus metalliredigens]ABR47241.1 ABC transporter related [Alkaliphilus metalliredigens QYMF]
MQLQIKGLQKSYKGQTVLCIEELTIPQGSFFGIIGPNGAGKSTLIKMIAGLIEPTNGLIEYSGASITDEIKQKMTLVFQKPYLLRTTVFNNIAYPLKIRKIEKEEIQRRVDRLLRDMEIEHLKDQKAWTLSGGEAQKVALARGIIFSPELLLLDEATANLDPTSVLMLEKQLKAFFHENKTTIIMITHNLYQAKRLCHDVAFMKDGKVIEVGNQEKVMNYPESHHTKEFICNEKI